MDNNEKLTDEQYQEYVEKHALNDIIQILFRMCKASPDWGNAMMDILGEARYYAIGDANYMIEDYGRMITVKEWEGIVHDME